MICHLCKSSVDKDYKIVKGRRIFECEGCQLGFVDQNKLSTTRSYHRYEEKEFYNLEQSIVQQGVSSLVERDSYIIEFINEPVFKKDKAIEDRIKNLKNELQKAENIGAQVKAESLGNEARILERDKQKDVDEYQRDLVLEHESALLDIKNRIVSEERSSGGFSSFVAKIVKVQDGNFEVSSEYYYLFNGISLSSISDSEAQLIESLPDIKKVYRNFQAEINLRESIPCC